MIDVIVDELMQGSDLGSLEVHGSLLTHTYRTLSIYIGG